MWCVKIWCVVCEGCVICGVRCDVCGMYVCMCVHMYMYMCVCTCVCVCVCVCVCNRR